jgi:hypothetical protein
MSDEPRQSSHANAGPVQQPAGWSVPGRADKRADVGPVEQPRGRLAPKLYRLRDLCDGYILADAFRPQHRSLICD